MLTRNRLAPKLYVQTDAELFPADDEVCTGPPRTGAWTPAEDEALRKAQDMYASIKDGRRCASWTTVAKLVQGRSGKQCRERWLNYLQPGIDKTPLTEEEKKLIVAAVEKHGNKWATIAAMLPGTRTENTVKNYYALSKKRESKGDYDPPGTAIKRKQNGKQAQPVGNENSLCDSDVCVFLDSLLGDAEAEPNAKRSRKAGKAKVRNVDAEIESACESLLHCDEVATTGGFEASSSASTEVVVQPIIRIVIGAPPGHVRSGLSSFEFKISNDAASDRTYMAGALRKINRMINTPRGPHA